MPGRTLAIGDIHGCDVALDVLLSHLGPTRDDRLILLGDVIDWGPNSRAVVQRLLQVQGDCTLIHLMGNHEEMLLAAVNGTRVRRWLELGGAATLRSYANDIARIPDAHLEWLSAAVPYWESDCEIFIHANLEPEVPLHEQTGEWLRWRRLTGHEQPHPSGRRVICGHTAMPSGLPRLLNGWVALDTLAYRGRFLTCLDIETNQIHQSRQSGQLRYGVTLQDLV